MKKEAQVIPQVPLAIETRDVPLGSIPAFRKMLLGIDVEHRSKCTLVPPFRLFVRELRNGQFVCVNAVEPLTFDVQNSDCSLIRVDVFIRYSRLTNTEKVLLEEYCGRILPIRQSRSAEKVHEALSECPAVFEHFQHRLGLRDPWKFESIKAVFPKLARSSWQAQLTGEQKRTYVKQKLRR